MKKGPFKMKGMHFGNSPIQKHPVTPPTKEESEKSKGTLEAGGFKTPGFRNIDFKGIKDTWVGKFKRLGENPFKK